MDRQTTELEEQQLTPEVTDEKPANTPPAEEPKLTKEQQKAIDAQIKAATEAAVQAAEEKWKKEQEKADEEAKGEFEKLYNAMKPKFEAQEAELEMLRAIVDAEIQLKASKLPEELKPLYELVGDDREAQLKWLQKAGDFKGKLGDPAPDTPPEGTPKSAKERDAEALQTRAATGFYS